MLWFMSSDASSWLGTGRDAGDVLAAAQIQTPDSPDLLSVVPGLSPGTPPGDQVTFFALSVKYYNRIPQNIHLSS